METAIVEAQIIGHKPWMYLGTRATSSSLLNEQKTLVKIPIVKAPLVETLIVESTKVEKIIVETR